MSKNKAKTVEEFDRRFDEGESIFELAEVKSFSRPNFEPQRVNVDFPKHFLQKLDREAQLRGVSRQALIKIWLYERWQLTTAGDTTAAAAETPKSTEEGRGTLRPAVVAILKGSKKPLRTAEIYDALVQQGYQFTFKDAKKGLGLRLYRMSCIQALGGGLFKAKSGTASASVGEGRLERVLTKKILKTAAKSEVCQDEANDIARAAR
jgi:hypothetical protein